MTECRGFIHCVLNMDIDARPSVQQILVSDWTRAEPSTRPIQLTPSNPSNKYKYTVENCLPSYLHHTRSRTSLTSASSLWAQSITAPYPTTTAYAAMIHRQYAKHRANEGDTPICSNNMPSSTADAEMAILSKRSSLVQGGQEPLDVQSIGEGSSLSLKRQYSHSKRPLVSKIGACGRKIADAVKSVKGQRGQKENSASRVNSGVSGHKTSQ